MGSDPGDRRRDSHDEADIQSAGWHIGGDSVGSPDPLGPCVRVATHRYAPIMVTPPHSEEPPGTHHDTIPVQVVRSDRRKKTVQARMIGDTLHIAIPGAMSSEEEAHWVREMRSRFSRRRTTESVDLMARCRKLARDLDLPVPDEIVWSERQRMRWGSCTPADRRIRVSTRLAGSPNWVLDYVLVHEMAHLRVANHSSGFWALVDRYPMAERARGYLIAKGEAEPDASGNE